MEPTKFEYEVQAMYGVAFASIAGFVSFNNAKEYADIRHNYHPSVAVRVICTVTGLVEYEV